MSNQKISISAEPRSVFGKKVNTLRAQGFVPAVVYERGKESVAVSLEAIPATKVVQAAGKHHPVTITIGTEERLAMIKDVDYEPKKNLIRHIAFHGVNKNQTVQAEIPLTLSGTTPAERKALMVLRTLDHVEVEALPNNLPDELVLDAEKLMEVGDQLTVADIKAPKDVTILTDPDQTVYIVEEPRSAAAEAAAEEAEQQSEADQVAAATGGTETEVAK